MAVQGRSWSSCIRRRRGDASSPPDILSERTRPEETPRLDIAPNDLMVMFFGNSSNVLDYINSTGIALIGRTLAKARASHSLLLASGLSEHYVEIFEISRLADFVNVYPTEAAALQEASAST